VGETSWEARPFRGMNTVRIINRIVMHYMTLEQRIKLCRSKSATMPEDDEAALVWAANRVWLLEFDDGISVAVAKSKREAILDGEETEST
jgi:hypothetical protein